MSHKHAIRLSLRLDSTDAPLLSAMSQLKRDDWSHVMLSLPPRPEDAPIGHPHMRAAYELIKRAGIELILERKQCMWPRGRWDRTHTPVPGPTAWRWPEYWASLISWVRAEAEAIEADATCLDLEPYGSSPFDGFENCGWLPQKYLDEVRWAIDAATAVAGTVDLMEPHGSSSHMSWQAPLGGVAKERIQRKSYYMRANEIEDGDTPWASEFGNWSWWSTYVTTTGYEIGGNRTLSIREAKAAEDAVVARYPGVAGVLVYPGPDAVGVIRAWALDGDAE
jgi:hypothetical protein